MKQEPVDKVLELLYRTRDDQIMTVIAATAHEIYERECQGHNVVYETRIDTMATNIQRLINIYAKLGAAIHAGRYSLEVK